LLITNITGSARQPNKKIIQENTAARCGYFCLRGSVAAAKKAIKRMAGRPAMG